MHFSGMADIKEEERIEKERRGVEGKGRKEDWR